MSNNTDNLNPTVAQSFLDELGNINFKEVSSTPSDSQGLTAITTDFKNALITFVEQWEGISAGAATTRLNNFFKTFDPLVKTINPTFYASTGESFVKQLTDYLGGTPAGSAGILSTFTTAYETFYTKMLDPSNGGELSQINPPPTAADLSTQAQNAFQAFVNNYAYPTSGKNLNSFISNISNFWAVTAQVQNNDVPATVTLATYENIYNSFIPNPPPPGIVVPSFSDTLTLFYNQQIQQQGYFIPSQSFGQWVTNMQQTYSRLLTGAAGTFMTSVDTASSKGVIILDKILLLIIKMITSLQHVAAAQADRLNFLTKWQKAYTDVGNQIHYFINGTDSLTGSKQSAGARNAMNSMNQNYASTIQANRSTISDDAKSLQSNVDQSNTAVNNQSDLGNSIFQQLSTILSSIFH